MRIKQAFPPKEYFSIITHVVAQIKQEIEGSAIRNI